MRLIQKNRYALLVLSFAFLSFTLQAKPLDIKQLFNKELVKVKEEEVGKSKNFYGKLLIDESKTLDIVSRYDGYITSLSANKTYMKLKKGDTLFTIYSDKVLSIQKELHISKTINKKFFTSSLEKLESLNISKNEINRIISSKKIKDIRVKTKMNAILLKKNINSGSYVKKGNLLLQLTSIESLWFVASIYQKDINFLKEDMSALVYVDGFSQAIKSKIDYIYPFVNDKTKTVNVRFLIDNKDLKLFPNMFAKVKLKSLNKTMLTLPKTAVLTKADKHYVFKATDNDEFEPTLVEANRISAYKYEIIDGLKLGDEVVNNALFLLDSDAVTNSLYDEDDSDW